MKALPARTPDFAQKLFPRRLWRLPEKEDTIYLTFDDGPIPELTPWVLDRLGEAGAGATFFCIGENAQKHPAILGRIRDEGHALGNHTFNHLNGWQTSTAVYMDNVRQVEKLFKTVLFRPPYGRIRPGQAKKLEKLGYTITMWDVLSYDWDRSVGPQECLGNVLDNLRPGSIVVFHDSLKAEHNLRSVLPEVLTYISQRGWKMKALPC